MLGDMTLALFVNVLVRQLGCTQTQEAVLAALGWRLGDGDL